MGTGRTPAAVRAALLEEPAAKAVLLTHNETSTGVTNPIPELAAVVREVVPGALILVDAISALGAVPFEMDAWDLDLVVTGSQKAWMSAPGMAFAAVGDRAWAAMETATMPRFYFDLRRARDSASSGQTPWTPAVAVMYQVDEGLRLMEEETPPGVFARHAACAAATRAGLTALGFALLADPDHASETVTAALVPDDLDWKAFNAEVKKRGLVVAGGQGKLKGKIFRVGHLGSVELEDILGAIAVMEEASLRVGRIGRARGRRRGRPAGRPGRARDAGRGTRDRGDAGMRILVAEPLAPSGIELLRQHHEVDERIGLTSGEYQAILPEYDALLVRSQVKVDAAMIAAGTRLSVIGRAGVGVDNVDLDAATHAGITVVNAPTGNTIAAAEHTLALMFALARKVAAADASMRRGEWKRSAFSGVELRGKVLGIVGLGKIGGAIADRARALEMTVLGSDPYVTVEAAENHGIELVALDELLERSDVVTLHVPKTRTTAGMLGAAQLARMKPTAFLLNVARGGVVDEAALAEALTAGTIAGAAIDVYSSEPPAADNPLLRAPNTVLTPHLGASTAEAQVAVAEEAAQQVLEVLDGRPARYAVNAPLLTPETARAIAPYLPLAEMLGRFFAQYSRGGARTVTLEVAGELAEHDVTPLQAAVLRGLLQGVTNERVNLVNAGTLAKARGITIVERKTTDAGPFATLVTISGTGSDETERTVAGTLANGEPRFVRLDDYWLDVAPAPWMLVSRHQDRPGMIGRVGSTLGAADVNISAMHLGRSAPRSDAVMLLALDDPVPVATEAALRAIDGILDQWVIDLEPGG